MYHPSHVDTQLGCAILLKKLLPQEPPDIVPPAPEPDPVPDIRESPAAEDKDEKPAVKSKTIWASIIGAASTVLAVVTDWRVIAVIAIAAFVFTVADRYFKLDIKGWFRS